MHLDTTVEVLDLGVFQITLFGKLRIEKNMQDIVALEARKAQELLCYLLLYRQRSHLREALTDLLWGDMSAAQSKPYLRKALWQLQSALNIPESQINQPVVLADLDWVQFNPNAQCWLDIAIFENAFKSVQDISGKVLDQQQIQTLTYVVDLYTGDLLEGWYTDWCIFERERFQYMYLAMLDKLMVYHEAQQDYEAGIIYGLQALRYDPARERTHRRLMRMQYLAGDRIAALRQYDRCISVLNKELDISPVKKTTALYQQIRSDDHDTDGDMPPPQKSHSAGDVLNALQQMQAMVAQLQQDIQSVKNVINSQD